MPSPAPPRSRAGLGRTQFRRLAADPRLPAWLRRALACAAVGILLGAAVDWRLGVAGVAVTAAIGMLFSVRTSAVVPASARAPSARRRTRHRLSRLASAGYLMLRDRFIADPGSPGEPSDAGTATPGTATPGTATAGTATAATSAAATSPAGTATAGTATAKTSAGGPAGPGGQVAEHLVAGPATAKTSAGGPAGPGGQIAEHLVAGPATAKTSAGGPAGPGGQIAEHLVAGPAGVFVIGSVHWDRRLPVRTARRGRLFHGPFDETGGLQRLARQAEQAGRQISEALGRVVVVRAALVIYGPPVPWPVMTIAEVDVLAGRRLRWYLRRESSVNRAARLTERQAEIIHAVANQVFPPAH